MNERFTGFIVWVRPIPNAFETHFDQLPEALGKHFAARPDVVSYSYVVTECVAMC